MPPQWRLERTAEFEADCETLRERAPRLHQVLESWEWCLERIPERFSRRPARPTDTDRVGPLGGTTATARNTSPASRFANRSGRYACVGSRYWSPRESRPRRPRAGAYMRECRTHLEDPPAPQRSTRHGRDRIRSGAACARQEHSAGEPRGSRRRRPSPPILADSWPTVPASGCVGEPGPTGRLGGCRRSSA